MNDRIDLLNSMLVEMTTINDLPLLTPHPLFIDGTGDLKMEYDSGDGAHLNPLGYKVLGEYIRDQVAQLLKPGVVIGCLGDSLTQGYPYSLSRGRRTVDGKMEFMSYPDHLKRPGVTIVNFGVNGDTTDGMLRRLREEVVPASLDFCIILGGTNDLLIGVSPLKVAQNIESICVQCVTAEISPICCTVLPVRDESIFAF